MEFLAKQGEVGSSGKGTAVIPPAEALRNLQQSPKERKETVQPLFPVSIFLIGIPSVTEWVHVHSAYYMTGQ